MSLQARYSIRRKIADGGTAEIFLATQLGAHGFEKRVVLKRIFTAFYADPQFRNMLVDEAHIAMSLNHSNIVQVLDLGESEGQYFLALELVDGWPLDALLRRVQALGANIPPPIALYITAEVCRALAYAHNKAGADGRSLGIVHRDITPHNVLLSEQGEVKITDFGIAKSRTRREKSLGNLIKGKIAFMSPEQASGEELDRRSDIYSLGTILYVMITRRYPYDAPTDYETLLLVKNGQPPLPETVRPGLNPELYRVIKRAMSKKLDDRYQRAEDMLVDVEQVMRLAFRAVGQTELMRWLADLTTRDGVQPLTKQGDGGAVPAIPHQSAVQSTASPGSGPVTGRRPPPVPPRGRPPRRSPEPTVVDPPMPGAEPKEDLKEIRTEDLTLEPVVEEGGKAARPPSQEAAATEVMAVPAPEAHAAAARAASTTPSPRPATGGTTPAPVAPDASGGAKPGRRRLLVVSLAGAAALVIVLLALRPGSRDQRSESRAKSTAVVSDQGPSTRSTSSTTAPTLPPPVAPAGPSTDAAVARPLAADAAEPSKETASAEPAVAPAKDEAAPAEAAADSASADAAAENGPSGTADDDDDTASAGEAESTASPQLFSAVTLRSTPMGASVQRGKKSLGTTPVTVKMKKGRWVQLVLTKEGYSPLVKKIRVGPTPTQRFNLALRKLPPAPGVNAGPKKPDDPASRKWWQVWR